MFCVPCKDLPGGMLNSLDLPCIQTSFSWSRLNSTIRKWPRQTGRFFFFVAELMCYLDEVYHQTIPCSCRSCLLCTQRKRHTQAARRIFFELRTSLVGVLLVHSNFGTFFLLLAYDHMNPTQRRGYAYSEIRASNHVFCLYQTSE